MDLNYATVVEAMADQLPDTTCLICGTQKLSYTQFEQRAARLTQCLSHHGLGQDSKVALFLREKRRYPSTLKYGGRCLTCFQSSPSCGKVM